MLLGDPPGYAGSMGWESFGAWLYPNSLQTHVNRAGPIGNWASAALGPRLGGWHRVATLATVLVWMIWPSHAMAGEWIFAPFGAKVPDTYGSHLSLAMNPVGEAALIYEFNGIRASIRPAYGEFEGPESGGVRIAEEGVYGSEPDVAIDARGDVVAVWQQNLGLYTRIYAATRLAGRGFDGPVPVSPEGENTSAPAVAIDGDGEATVAWLEEDHKSEVVQVARASLDGLFGSPTPLSDREAPASNPKVAVDRAGDTVVSWARQGDLEVASRPAGGSFPAPDADGNAEVLGELASSSMPDVVIDEAGEALAEWQAPDGSVRTARAPAGVPAFGPVEKLGSSAGLPSAAINEVGEAAVAWPSSGGVQVATGAPGTPFGKPIELPSAFLASATHVAMGASGDASVEWEASSELGTYREGSLVAPGGAFAEPTGLFTSLTMKEGSLVVASDAAGDMVGVWDTVSLGAMESMLYDRGPQIAGISASATGVVGQPVSFSIPPPVSVWLPPNLVAWSFGDGTTANGLSVSHTYAAPGNYVVTVTANDPQHVTPTTDPAPFPKLVSNSLTATVSIAPVATATSSTGPASTGPISIEPTSTGPTSTGPTSTGGANALANLSISPGAFLTGASGPSATAEMPGVHLSGATVAFTLILPGTVTFTVERPTSGIERGKKCLPVTSGTASGRARHCPVLRALGSFTRNGSAGVNHFHFSGRLDGRALAAGSYLLAGVRDNAQRLAQQVAFRVLRR